MKKLFNLLLVLSTLLSASCDKNDDAEVPDVPGTTTNTDVKVTIDDSYIGNTLSTSTGELVIGDKESVLHSSANGKVKTFVVNDGENVFLMARIPTEKNTKLTIDAKSTTLALVTMYPLFSPVDANGYESLVSLITSSSKYQALQDEVSKCISEGRNIYDVENEDLLKAFNDLIEDICGNVDEETYDNELVTIENSNLSSTRATYESAKLNPTYIKADITRNRLTLRTVGLTPTYFGTVTHTVEGTKNIKLGARDDFGGLDLFTRTADNWRYGEPMTYTFLNNGEYQFYFSRMTPEATADFYLRLANSLLYALGVDLGTGVLPEIGNSISRAMINAGSGVNDNVIDPMAWIGIAYEAILNKLKSGTIRGFRVSDSFIFGSKFLLGALNWYNRIKGVGNAATRIAFAMSAPEEFDFCLCNYNNQVTTCSEANIQKVSGDNQNGYAKQKLLNPLRVSVRNIDENGMYVESSNYHRVKYEVTKGGGSVSSDLVTVGSDKTASVEWTLGESGEQEVRAVVIDIITEKEISEPVYFSASLGTAAITVRLDWSRHSGKTDIDLHVVDPSGERIYFGHMRSASGGYLDRDDTYGPGPEHIRWTNAPAGTYKIYVHYYPNEDPDKSIVSYKVSVTANGKTYRPVSNSISYNEMVPVGQFTIDNTTRTAARLISVEAPEDFVVPRKE